MNAATLSKRVQWIDSREFDLTFILGVAALAIGSGLLVIAVPSLWLPVLAADLWFLGYHHVIATFTRLAFDKKSIEDHRFLLFILPWIVLAATGTVAYSIGPWSIATIYLYWQWFHYTRQSYGIAKVYMRKANLSEWESRCAVWALYLVPAFGILALSQRMETAFLGMTVKTIPVLLHEIGGVPLELAFTINRFATNLFCLLAAVAVMLWIINEFRASQHRERLALNMYLLSHFAVFMTGYYAIENINYGWLVLNVWHNAQYILFVWWFNTRRFQTGVSAQQHFISWLSQRNVLNVCCYFLVCFCLSTAVYVSISQVLKMSLLATVPALILIVYQTINFHHYVVDSLIWKKPKPKSAPAPATPVTA